MYNINTIEELDQFIIDNKSNVILLYFGAYWCGPCTLLKNRLSDNETKNRLPLLKICYIDVDINQTICTIYDINSLPTLIFIKLEYDKVITVSKIIGSDYTKLLLEYDNYVINYMKKID